MQEKTSPTPLKKATNALALGKLIAHPTETLFGLAADPFNPKAMARLTSLKGRPEKKGFILLIPDSSWIKQLTQDLSPLALRLIKQYWPGPLTLVLPAHPSLSSTLTESDSHFNRWIALRHSPHPLVQALLKKWKKPIASTSANQNGQSTPSQSDTVRQQWGTQVQIVLEGKTQDKALPSTLIKVEKDHLQLLRAGALSLKQLNHDFPNLEIG